MSAFVDRTRAGSVVRLTLCHEGRGNAVSVDLLEDLDRRLEEIEADHSVRVVVLTGRGRTFSVGADLAAPPSSGGSGGTPSLPTCRGSVARRASSSACTSCRQ